jgi:hypothetical protein
LFPTYEIRTAVFAVISCSSVKFHCWWYGFLRLREMALRLGLAGILPTPGNGLSKVNDGVVPAAGSKVSATRNGGFNAN